MRVYAEQTWGTWNGRADLDPSFDKIVQLAGTDIGLIGVERHADHWFLAKLYLLPAYQNRGLGGWLLQRLMQEASLARVPLRLTVLEVNPARRFYERHGFVLTHCRAIIWNGVETTSLGKYYISATRTPNSGAAVERSAKERPGEG